MQFVVHSYLSASTGLSPAAFLAGYTPKNSPTAAEKPTAMTTADTGVETFHVGDRKHLIREAMQNLENQLDPARFVRIHRSAIVQLDRVEALLKSPGGECDVQLKNGVKVRVARSRREELEKRLVT